MVYSYYKIANGVVEIEIEIKQEAQTANKKELIHNVINKKTEKKMVKQKKNNVKFIKHEW